MTCATNCCGLIVNNRLTARRSFHRIWIASKLLVKQDLESQTHVLWLIKGGPFPHLSSMHDMPKISILENCYRIGKSSFNVLFEGKREATNNWINSHEIGVIPLFCIPFIKMIRIKVLLIHYNDVIMSAMASQITSLAIVYSTVYSRRRSKKTSKLRVTGVCEGNSPVTGEFPAQRASNPENVSIWWLHHVL